MELEQPTIRKIIINIDNQKTYSIDVDEITTFYEVKKIISAAAHLLKNSYRIYYKDQEYNNEYDRNTIQEMFQDISPIHLKLISYKILNENEEEKEIISFEFNINQPCENHIGKYKMHYCFSCQKSICRDCRNKEHKDHLVEEKTDYLAPAEYLMNDIFSNSSSYRADPKISKYMDCVNFRSNLQMNIFVKLKNMINKLESQISSCLEYFNKSVDLTENNINENLELLKKYCTECYIKLKNDINTKEIILDDDIFLTLYGKLIEIQEYKINFFKVNKEKYENLNSLYNPFIEEINQYISDLSTKLNNLINKDIYEIFIENVKQYIVNKIEKESVEKFIFNNIEVERKSQNIKSKEIYKGSIIDILKKEASNKKPNIDDRNKNIVLEDALDDQEKLSLIIKDMATSKLQKENIEDKSKKQ